MRTLVFKSQAEFRAIAVQFKACLAVESKPQRLYPWKRHSEKLLEVLSTNPFGQSR
jgi:hypothetical protein